MKDGDESKDFDLLSKINLITEEGRLISIHDAIKEADGDEKQYRISKGWSVLENRKSINSKK